MELKGVNVGFILTGSFSRFKAVIPKMKDLLKQDEAKIIPIMSFNGYKLNTKFGKAKDYINEIEDITCNKIIHTISEAQEIGRKGIVDIMVIAPCTRKYNSETCL